ncbi:hypothetical protein L610_007600000040 [Aminobacter sp. J44]|nr:hypothetical protein L610_007600000040 [Aminobacter sp. J44]
MGLPDQFRRQQDGPLSVLPTVGGRAAMSLRDLANRQRRFGYRRLIVLLRREVKPSGINCIYRCAGHQILRGCGACRAEVRHLCEDRWEDHEGKNSCSGWVLSSTSSCGVVGHEDVGEHAAISDARGIRIRVQHEDRIRCSPCAVRRHLLHLVNSSKRLVGSTAFSIAMVGRSSIIRATIPENERAFGLGGGMLEQELSGVAGDRGKLRLVG